MLGLRDSQLYAYLFKERVMITENNFQLNYDSSDEYEKELLLSRNNFCG